MDMGRRGILGATVALPAWLSFGFAPGPAATSAPSRLQTALERAREFGKPLLVLLVPKEEPLAVPRGELWGCYFANLSDDQALDLSLCEVTCARASDIENVTNAPLKDVDAATWAVLLETDVDPARPVRAHGPLPNDGTLRDEHNERSDDPSGTRAALEKLLRAVILPDDAARERRLAQCRARIARGKFLGAVDADDPEAREEGIISEPPIRRGDLDRWAALVRLVHFPDPPKLPVELRARFTGQLPLLADAVRIRLFENAPDGATWMLHSMNCPPCGMGYVPPTSRFFLKFLTQ